MIPPSSTVKVAWSPTGEAAPGLSPRGELPVVRAPRGVAAPAIDFGCVPLPEGLR